MKSNLAFVLALLSAPAFAELYVVKSGNDPANMRSVLGMQLIGTFDSLPTSGRLMDTRLGWSETYWPSNIGGVAYRWNHPSPMPFTYHLHTKEELMVMSQEQLGQLSPAELYDISKGDYTYKLTKMVLGENKPTDIWWTGICHGWSSSALNYPEPMPVVMTNPDGIKVPLGASDVKALLTLHDAYNGGPNVYGRVGEKCRVKGKVPGEDDSRDEVRIPPPPELAASPDCSDVNAGTFHVVLTNYIGIHSKGLVADVDRFNDVWNQPVTSYSTETIGEEAVTTEQSLAGVQKKLRIKTKMTYGEELKFYTPQLEAEGKKNFVSKLPVTMTPHQEFRFKIYEYIIELDAAGKIIGGEWVSQTRPDFIWGYKRPKQFRDSPKPLGALNKIYRPVMR